MFEFNLFFNNYWSIVWENYKTERNVLKKGGWEKVCKGNDHIVGLSIKGGSNPHTTDSRWPSSMAFWKDFSRLNIHYKRTSLKVCHLNRTTP